MCLFVNNRNYSKEELALITKFDMINVITYCAVVWNLDCYELQNFIIISSVNGIWQKLHWHLGKIPVWCSYTRYDINQQAIWTQLIISRLYSILDKNSQLVLKNLYSCKKLKFVRGKRTQNSSVSPLQNNKLSKKNGVFKRQNYIKGHCYKKITSTIFVQDFVELIVENQNPVAIHF